MKEKKEDKSTSGVSETVSEQKERELPVELADLVGGYLEEEERAALHAVSKKSESKNFDTEQFKQSFISSVQTLLLAVSKDDYDVTEKMVDYNYALILAKESFTEKWLGQRKWQTPISPLQYAAWAGDTKTLEMFIKKLPDELIVEALSQLDEVMQQGTQHGRCLSSVANIIKAYEQYSEEIVKTPMMEYTGERHLVSTIGRMQLKSTANFIHQFIGHKPADAFLMSKNDDVKHAFTNYTKHYGYWDDPLMSRSDCLRQSIPERWELPPITSRSNNMIKVSEKSYDYQPFFSDRNLIKRLYKQKSDSLIHIETELKNKLLDIAAKHEDIKLLYKLLNTLPDQFEHDDKVDLVHLIFAKGQASLLKAVLDMDGINPNEEDSNGNTPLMLAIKNKQHQFTELLLNDERVKEQINKVNKKGETAFDLAVPEPNLPLICKLLKIENVKIAPNQLSQAIFNASDSADFKSLTQLLAVNGVNVVLPDKNTPLTLAIIKDKSLPYIESLLTCALIKSNVHVSNADNKTALKLALEKNNRDLLRTLLTIPNIITPASNNQIESEQVPFYCVLNQLVVAVNQKPKNDPLHLIGKEIFNDAFELRDSLFKTKPINSKKLMVMVTALNSAVEFINDPSNPSHMSKLGESIKTLSKQGVEKKIIGLISCLLGIAAIIAGLALSPITAGTSAIIGVKVGIGLIGTGAAMAGIGSYMYRSGHNDQNKSHSFFSHLEKLKTHEVNPSKQDEDKPYKI